MILPIKPYGAGSSLLLIWVTPSPASNRIGNIVIAPQQHAYLKVYVTSVAEKGLANKAVIQLLSKKLGLSKSSFKLIAGETDRKKQLLITIPPDQLTRHLAQAIGTLLI
jgi:uncharacterized protein YggU (UPF0235/DUF167 family)